MFGTCTTVTSLTNKITQVQWRAYPFRPKTVFSHLQLYIICTQNIATTQLQLLHLPLQSQQVKCLLTKGMSRSKNFSNLSEKSKVVIA